MEFKKTTRNLDFADLAMATCLEFRQAAFNVAKGMRILSKDVFGGMRTPPELKQKFRHLWPHLNVRGKRMVAAEEALQFG